MKDSVPAGLFRSFRQAGLPERLLYLCAVSVFLPFVFTCGMLLTTVVYGLLKKELRQAMLHQKGNRLFLVLCGMLAIVPLIHRNWISLLAGAGGILVLLFFLYVRSLLTPGRYLVALDWCCLASFFSFFCAVAEKLVLGPCFRATGGMLNANYYGMAIEFLLLICVSRILSSPHHLGFYLQILVINLMGLFLCDSQSVWLAVLGGVVLQLFLAGRHRAAGLFGLFALLFLLVIILTPGLLPRLDRLPESFETRLSIWQTAWKGFLAHPLFGQGLLAYFSIWKDYGGYATYHAHSLYLDPLLSFGAAGTAGIAVYAGFCFRKVKRMLAFSETRGTAALIFSLVFALCIHGVTDLPLLWFQTGMLFFLTAGGMELGVKQASKGE